jgi:hypothetical protein
MSTVPVCRTVTVHTFRGDRTKAFGQRVFRALDDERNGRGPGPSVTECLLLAGHTGVSTDDDKAVYGFNPETGNLPIWQVMQRLRRGDAFAGRVRDDTQVFADAAAHGLAVMTFEVVLPDPGFQVFQGLLAEERRKSRYSYGFPDGDGDCNCTTWLERLALPLLTGSMDEFTSLPGFIYYPRRRFGQCV